MGLKITLFFAIAFCWTSTYGQNDNHEEAVYLSLSSTNLLVGDDLRFSAFVYSSSTKKPSKLSSVLYVELLNERDESVYQTKIGLVEGRGAGSIYINSSMFNGTYRLIAFTRWMRNYDTYFEQPILVFNPHNGIMKNAAITGNPLRFEKSPAISGVFNEMQSVSLTIGTIEKATLSINIEKASTLYYDNKLTLQESGTKLESFEILPEYRYAMVQGVVKKDAKSLENTRINMTMKGSSIQVSTTTSDQFGRFWMSYNPALIGNEGLLQVEDTTFTKIQLVDEFYKAYPSLPASQTILDSATAKELVERSIITQVKKAYKPEKPIDREYNEGFVGLGAFTYELKDYIRFPSIRDTFIEYISRVKVSKSEDNFEMEVRCEELPGLIATKFSVLTLLDGMIVDPEDILRLSPNVVEKIEVLPTYYFVNDATYKGVVSVHTSNKSKLEFAPKGTRLKLTDYQEYNAEGYAISLSDKHLPWYEPSVYWDPIYNHDGGNLVLNFSTPRLSGIYAVSIRGISGSGKAINKVQYIQVENSGL